MKNLLIGLVALMATVAFANEGAATDASADKTATHGKKAKKMKKEKMEKGEHHGKKEEAAPVAPTAPATPAPAPTTGH